jgi:hypothetical protein
MIEKSELGSHSRCMRTMSVRVALLLIFVSLAVACSSTSPTQTKVVHLGSLGTPGCKPEAAFHDFSGPAVSEVGVDSSRGSFWALFFTAVPPPAGKEIKVVWRMTGSGEFTFRASDADGMVIPPVRTPQPHGVNGSTWNHPGFEVATGFNFPHSGCWRINVERSDVAGDLWLQVSG